MARARPLTDLYVAAVEQALAAPGEWIEVPRAFATEANALVTAACLRGGYLRARPRPGERVVRIGDARYLGAPAPVEAETVFGDEEWHIRIRAAG